MTEKQTLSGGCFCKKVRFDAYSKPASIAICHCRSCQRSSGADSVAWAVFPMSAVAWSGEERLKYESSPGVSRTFCGNCGTSLSYQCMPGSIDLVIACFDDPEALSPDKEIWLDHRISWNARNPELPGYKGFSEGSEPV